MDSQREAGGTIINRLEAVDFLKEVYATFGETLTISSAWLSPSSKTGVNDPQDYDIVLNAEFNEVEIKSINSVLKNHNLEMKKEQKGWLIFKATNS